MTSQAVRRTSLGAPRAGPPARRPSAHGRPGAGRRAARGRHADLPSVPTYTARVEAAPGPGGAAPDPTGSQVGGAGRRSCRSPAGDGADAPASSTGGAGPAPVDTGRPRRAHVPEVRRTMGTIVVGYVPKPEGRAALRRAAEEAKLRDKPSSSSTPTAAVVSSTATSAIESSPQLEEVREQLRAAGVEHEVRQLVRGLDPADDLVNVAERGAGRHHRDRPAPPVARRQADPRQQRPAGAARRTLPGAGGQGRGRGAPLSRRPRRSVRADGQMALQIAQDPHADRGPDRQPVRAALRDAARPAVPDGAGLRRPGQDPRPVRAVPSTRDGRRGDPEEFAALVPSRRRVHRFPARWPRGSRRWRPRSSRSTTATPTRSGSRP